MLREFSDYLPLIHAAPPTIVHSLFKDLHDPDKLGAYWKHILKQWFLYFSRIFHLARKKPPHGTSENGDIVLLQ